MDWALAIIALSFLIVVHEAGHYVVARWCGMRVDRFSIGFGPGLLKRQSKRTGTVFQIAPILFGGYVEIRGMNIAEDVDPEDRFAYPNRPTWQRFATIFAGPATNYLSAVVLAFLLFAIHGADAQHWYAVDSVTADGASVGKLEVDDRIISVNHVPVLLDPGAPKLTEQITAANGAPVTLSIVRAGKPVEVTIHPKAATDSSGHKVWQVGIMPKAENLVVGRSIIEAAGDALAFPVVQTEAIAGGLYGIITGKTKADPHGPKGIVDEFHKAFVAGIVPGIKLVMMLSVYLGLFNLFPLPALDGGRLVFLGYELVTRRRANPKIETTVHMGGIMVLAVVMVLVTLHDFSVF